MIDGFAETARTPLVENLPPIDLETKKFAKAQASYIDGQLKGLNINGFLKTNNIKVKNEPRAVSADAYGNTLNLGILGFDENGLALGSFGEQGYIVAGRERTLIPLVIAPGSDGPSLLKDENGTVYADRFWQRTKKGYELIIPDKPIPLHGVFAMYDRERDFNGMERALAANKELFKITENKQKTKNVLKRAGIKVPEGIFIPHDMREDLDMQLSTLSEKFDTSHGFVVKANTGSGGIYVRLFSGDNIEGAKAYAESLFSQGKDIIIERKITPTEVELTKKSGEILAKHESDYNVRVLTTLGSRSRVIDSEVRFGKKGGPINIHQGAEATRMGNVFSHERAFFIGQTAADATEVLCDEIDPSSRYMMGFAGIDIIPDHDGTPYVIEANSGAVGGIGTLTRLDGKIPDSLRTVLFASCVQKLLENSMTTPTLTTKTMLERFKPNSQDETLIAYTQVKSGDVEKAEPFIYNLLSSTSRTAYTASALYAIALALQETGSKQLGLACAQKAIFIDPSVATYKAAEISLLREAGRKTEAEEKAKDALESFGNNEYIIFQHLLNLVDSGDIDEAMKVLSGHRKTGLQNEQLTIVQKKLGIAIAQKMTGHKTKAVLGFGSSVPYIAGAIASGVSKPIARSVARKFTSKNVR